MIEIELIDVCGWKAAIRGMRNAKNSWDKSDSNFSCEFCGDCYWEYSLNSDGEQTWCNHGRCAIGDNDNNLMQTLADAGTDHGKFLRMIVVYLDINAPLYWWKEMDTYRVGVEKNSCSTMHKIHAKRFVLEDFSYDHLMTSHYDSFPIHGIYDGIVTSPVGMLVNTIKVLNVCREKYLETKDKRYWWQLIQLLPSTYNQRRTCMISYAALRNMYHARKHHKLDEWRTFCEWIETLPYSEFITGVKSECMTSN